MQEILLRQNEIYKDSNIEWVDNIPQDWETRRGKFLMESKKELNTGMACDNVLSLTMNGVLHRDELGEGGLLPSDYSTFQIFYPNDLVFKLIDLENYKTSRVGIVDEKGIMSSAYIRVYSQNHYVYPKYFYYFYFNLYLQGIYNFIGMGVRSTMNFQDLLELQVVIPPYKTQQKIADFLDEKTAKIDQIIAKKQKLIELLKEKRISIITQAVTKGLDPNAKMKPTGVEWIGDMPEEWQLIKIKYISKVRRGASPRPIDDAVYFDSNGRYAWVRIEDVTRDGMFLRHTTQRLSELGSSLSVKLLPNSLFISIAGSVGKPCITKINACIHDGFVYFPYMKFNNEYLYYIFEGGEAFQGLGKLGTQLNLNTFTVGEIVIPVPMEKEMIQIVNHLNKITSETNNILTKIQNETTLLEEYRSSLIYNAVTGKIKI